MVKVLFVCLGNICRSPMAEAIFRDIIQKENAEGKILVDSAGTGSWHVGSIPHEGTRKILDQHNIAYQGQQARQVKKTDFTTYDYIIAMDEQNKIDLQSIQEQDQKVEVRKLMDFVSEPKETDIPDPYFTGDFDYTYELVSEACRNVFYDIKKHHYLK